MAVSNKNKFLRSAEKYGVKDFQLIMGNDKKGLNVKGLLIGGYMFDRLSNYGTDREDTSIDDLMECIACEGVAKAHELHVNGRNSVAKQKVNEAHGRSNDERFDYLLKQMMTYANRFSGIQFVNQTMESVFDQLIKRETITLDQWVKGMKDWHGSNAKALVLNAIKNKSMHVLNDNKVICDCTFRDFVSEYAKQNKLHEPTDEQKGQMIAVYLKGLERV